MWDTNSAWFGIALLNGMTAFGTIFFGHFELHTPRSRKVVKQVALNGVIVALSLTLGLPGVLTFFGVMIAMVVVIHGIVLPRKGINGWTGEPKEKYYRMRGWEKYLRK